MDAVNHVDPRQIDRFAYLGSSTSKGDDRLGETKTSDILNRRIKQSRVTEREQLLGLTQAPRRPSSQHQRCNDHRETSHMSSNAS